MIKSRSTLLAALCVLLVAAPIFADDIDLDAIKSKLPESLSNLTNSVEKVQKAVRDKCIRVSGNDDVYDDVEKAPLAMKECLEKLVNVTQLKEEIEAAKPTGDLDTVFNRYCGKRHTALECVKTFAATVDPCLDETEKKSSKTMVDIFTSLLNFVCFKEGDHIALFIAEKGPECFQDKAEAMKNCTVSTFSHYYPNETVSLDNLPAFNFGEKECDDFDKYGVCLVNTLEKCEETTPANLVEATFKFIRKRSPCADMVNKYQQS